MKLLRVFFLFFTIYKTGEVYNLRLFITVFITRLLLKSKVLTEKKKNSFKVLLWSATSVKVLMELVQTSMTLEILQTAKKVSSHVSHQF